jgi:hypothetical protein
MPNTTPTIAFAFADRGWWRAGIKSWRSWINRPQNWSFQSTGKTLAQQLSPPALSANELRLQRNMGPDKIESVPRIGNASRIPQWFARWTQVSELNGSLIFIFKSQRSFRSMRTSINSSHASNYERSPTSGIIFFDLIDSLHISSWFHKFKLIAENNTIIRNH